MNNSWLPKWKPPTLPKWKAEMSTAWFSKWNDAFFVPCWWLFLAKTFNIAPSNIAHHNWHVCDHMSMGRVPIGYRRIQSCEPSIGTREWKIISQRGSLSCSRPACFQDKGCASVAKEQYRLISQKHILKPVRIYQKVAGTFSFHNFDLASWTS